MQHNTGKIITYLWSVNRNSDSSEHRVGTRYARHEDQEEEAPDYQTSARELISNQNFRSAKDPTKRCGEWKAPCKIHPKTG